LENITPSLRAIRRSQEALELAAKACLRYLGVEYPKQYDVGDALESIGEKLPEELKAKSPEFKELLSRLAEVRGPSMYGFEKEGIPPEQAFSLEFASEVFSKVREPFKLCKEFVGTDK
jgi:HEPN domain-containing protein